LSWAAENGHESVVKLLLERGVEVDSKDIEYGLTPLSWAALRGHESVVKLLFEKDSVVDLSARLRSYSVMALSTTT
jgi:ankyrin repeat protein